MQLASLFPWLSYTDACCGRHGARMRDACTQANWLACTRALSGSSPPCQRYGLADSWATSTGTETCVFACFRRHKTWRKTWIGCSRRPRRKQFWGTPASASSREGHSDPLLTPRVIQKLRGWPIACAMPVACTKAPLRHSRCWLNAQPVHETVLTPAPQPLHHTASLHSSANCFGGLTSALMRLVKASGGQPDCATSVPGSPEVEAAGERGKGRRADGQAQQARHGEGEH